MGVGDDRPLTAPRDAIDRRWLSRLVPHISIEGEDCFAKRDVALAREGA